MTEIQPAQGNGKQHGPSINTEEMIQKTRSVLRDQLDHQPYVVLGVAAAVGYVLAAGIPRVATAYLLRYGLRAGMRSGLRNLVGSMVSGPDEE